MKQAMFLIAKTLPLVTWLGRVAPHTPFEIDRLAEPNFYFILILIDRIILILIVRNFNFLILF